MRPRVRCLVILTSSNKKQKIPFFAANRYQFQINECRFFVKNTTHVKCSIAVASGRPSNYKRSKSLRNTKGVAREGKGPGPPPN